MTWGDVSAAGLHDANAPFGPFKLEPELNWLILEDFLRLAARDNNGTI